MNMKPPIPILRSFDEAKMREFYLDYLGFSLDWTHRFDPDAPLYAQLSHGACVLHLSEHVGDATPGSAMRIWIDDLDGFHKTLEAKRYRYYRPGIVDQPWGRDMSVQDPFGNRLTFYDGREA